MPREYHPRQPGKRPYMAYTAEQLDEAVERVKCGEISQRKAEEVYGISRATLRNKLSGVHGGQCGRPRVFSEMEESVFADRIALLSDWGFPLDKSSVRLMVKDYLSRNGHHVSQFKDNCPGMDWVESFMQRHNFTNRIASNIKRKRAEISAGAINNYFDNLERELHGVPPENIWNYDETNLQDDPGKRKCIIRRGHKYPERVVNCSKVGFSVMFCGNANGEMLPPYTVYKAAHLYDQWRKGGPKKARFNRSKSGWFDEVTFADWFNTVALPRLKCQEGVKALIGDNLACHLNESVIRLCQENNIKFLCLPPNSTHLTQPLDVAYFRPMKVHWRKTLEEWKQSREGKACLTLPKCHFPFLLKRLLQSLDNGNGQQNLIAGFQKCGICPVDRQKVLHMLPRDRYISPTLVGAAVDETVMNMLRGNRGSSSNVSTLSKPSKPAKKRLRLDVEPGKSVAVMQSSEDECEDSTDNENADSKHEDSDGGDDDIPKLPAFPVPKDNDARPSVRIRHPVDRFY